MNHLLFNLNNGWMIEFSENGSEILIGQLFEYFSFISTTTELPYWAPTVEELG
jgi:hypothetical protein